jgi:DNA-binding response OmpR family regulator
MKITNIIEKVLIIDDDQASNHLTEELINKLGFAEKVAVKHNGNDALHYLQSECYFEDSCPSLVILDLKMPVLDGFEFLDEFNKLDLVKKDKIVIVILTNSDNPDDIIRLRNMGRYYLIRKPLTMDKLVDIYHKYFRNSPR